MNGRAPSTDHSPTPHTRKLGPGLQCRGGRNGLRRGRVAAVGKRNFCSGRSVAVARRPLDGRTPRRLSAICYVRSTSTPAVRSQWRNPTAEADSLDLGRPSRVSCWRDGAFARYANARRRLPFYPFVSPCNSVMEPSASSTLKSTPVPSKVRMTSRASSFPSV